MNYVKRKYRNFDPQKTLFKKISIGVVSVCNGKCPFCPSPYLKRPYKHISMGLFADIINQLKSLDYSGEVGLNLQSDPFCIPDVVRLVNYTSRNLPKATVFLSTNGLGMNVFKYHGVLSYPNVKMLVNDYGDGSLKKKIARWGKTKSEKKRTFLVNKKEPNSKTNVGYFDSGLDLPLEQFCIAPFIQLCIGPYGEAVMCCLDWERYYRDVGDTNNESLMDIWCGKRMEAQRSFLLRNERRGLCAKCDMMGHRWSLK